ncbi:MAG: SOS response-associated peptidase [Oscillospiraceae bacterium]|nr:SOS response-associated peptidase [Oscillospiraceae bacterium]
MCGRYIIEDGEDVVEMRKIFDKLKGYYSDTVEYQKVKKGEIFPTDTVPVIIPERELSVDIVPMQWGFTPFNKNSRTLINARSESVFDKPTFREAVINRRCVIPANGFFEWERLQTGNKQKYLIRPAASRTLYFAGIYDKKIDYKTKKELVHFVIITREARGLLRSIHDRMPVTVAKRDILKWLNGNENNARGFFTDLNIPEYTFTQAY